MTKISQKATKMTFDLPVFFGHDYKLRAIVKENRQKRKIFEKKTVQKF